MASRQTVHASTPRRLLVHHTTYLSRPCGKLVTSHVPHPPQAAYISLQLSRSSFFLTHHPLRIVFFSAGPESRRHLLSAVLPWRAKTLLVLGPAPAPTSGFSLCPRPLGRPGLLNPPTTAHPMYVRLDALCFPQQSCCRVCVSELSPRHPSIACPALPCHRAAPTTTLRSSHPPHPHSLFSASTTLAMINFYRLVSFPSHFFLAQPTNRLLSSRSISATPAASVHLTSPSSPCPDT